MKRVISRLIDTEKNQPTNQPTLFINNVVSYINEWRLFDIGDRAYIFRLELRWPKINSAWW